MAGPRREAKIPILDLMAAAMPRVGPGEDGRPRPAWGNCGARLPGNALGLRLLAVAAGVAANFPDDPGALAGEVLQAGKLAFELHAGFQVDVEADEIEER